MPDGSPRSGVLEAFTACDGWWVVYESKGGRWYRRRVAGWGTFRAAGRLMVAPMVTRGADVVLAPPGYDGGELWHDGESYCRCHRAEYDRDASDTEDDIWWCDTCAGEIPR